MICLIYIKKDSKNVPINSVNTFSSISTGIAITLVDVDLTIGPARARATSALIPIDEILAVALVLARIRFAFVDLSLAEITGESLLAVAYKFILAVNALASVTGRRLTVVDIRLAIRAWKGMANKSIILILCIY